MTIKTPVQKESTAAGYIATAKVASLHAADPGTTGANEITGGSPAYARRPIVWNAGDVDGVYTSNAMDFDVPAGDIAFAGVWDDGGVFRDSCTAVGTFTAQGVFRLVLTYTQN